MRQRLSQDECEHLPNRLRGENNGQLTVGDASNKVKQIDVATCNIDTGNVTTAVITTGACAAQTLSGSVAISGATTCVAAAGAANAYTVGSAAVVFVNCTANTFSVTLPASSGKRLVCIKKVDNSTNAITVINTGGTIEYTGAAGGGSYTAMDAEGDMVQLLGDGGTNYYIIGKSIT